MKSAVSRTSFRWTAAMARSARSSAIAFAPTRCRSDAVTKRPRRVLLTPGEASSSRALGTNAWPSMPRTPGKQLSQVSQAPADHTGGRNLLPRQPATIDRCALRAGLDHAALAAFRGTRARQQKAECSSQHFLGDPRSNRIGKLAGTRRPAHRDLVTGRADQTQEHLGNILGLVKQRARVQRSP